MGKRFTVDGHCQGGMATEGDRRQGSESQDATDRSGTRGAGSHIGERTQDASLEDLVLQEAATGIGRVPQEATGY